MPLIFAAETGIERYRRIIREEKLKRQEVLVFTGTVEGALAAREDKLRTIYFPTDEEEQEPKGLIYYRKISDLLEGISVLRSLT